MLAVPIWSLQNLLISGWPWNLTTFVQSHPGEEMFYTVAAKWHFRESRVRHLTRGGEWYLREVLSIGKHCLLSTLYNWQNKKELNQCLWLLSNFKVVRKWIVLWSFCRELCSQIAHCSLATSATIGALPAERPLFVAASDCHHRLRLPPQALYSCRWNTTCPSLLSSIWPSCGCWYLPLNIWEHFQ